jgi:NTE family protein
MNQLLRLTDKEIVNQDGRRLKPIAIQVISPSEDIDLIADDYVSDLPKSIRTFLKTSGGSASAGEINIASYLLFTPRFCKRLIDLGYKDGLAKRDDIEAFLKQPPESD